MIPQNSLTPYLEIGFLQPPDNNTDISSTLDYQLGGIGLNDGSRGLQYQNWKLVVQNPNLSNSSIEVSPVGGSVAFTLSVPYITWGRLSFDQNMSLVIAYVANNQSYLYWYDPTIPGYTSTLLPSYVSNPCVSMDDKRYVSILLGYSDVILAYIKNTDLVVRQQRDRYTVEYVLYANITNIVTSPYVFKIGMNNYERLSFLIRGALYL